jgi:hypothetical protein
LRAYSRLYADSSKTLYIAQHKVFIASLIFAKKAEVKTLLDIFAAKFITVIDIGFYALFFIVL